MATRMLRIAEVTHKTGLSRSTIYKLMAEQESDLAFPQSVKLSKRTVAWTESSVDEWLAVRIYGGAV